MADVLFSLIQHSLSPSVTYASTQSTNIYEASTVARHCVLPWVMTPGKSSIQVLPGQTLLNQCFIIRPLALPDEWFFCMHQPDVAYTWKRETETWLLLKAMSKKLRYTNVSAVVRSSCSLLWGEEHGDNSHLVHLIPRDPCLEQPDGVCWSWNLFPHSQSLVRLERLDARSWMGQALLTMLWSGLSSPFTLEALFFSFSPDHKPIINISLMEQLKLSQFQHLNVKNPGPQHWAFFILDPPKV
jgi:hypothetical protein